MKVILLETIEHLGKVGDSVNVKPGYARNFLFPRGMAILATASALKQIETKIEVLKKQEAEAKMKLEEEAKDLSKIVLTFPMKVGEEEKLFGSVSSSDIAEKLSQKLGRAVEKGELELAQPLKALGEYKVLFKLGHGLHAEITVAVVPEGIEKKSEEKLEKTAATEKPVKRSQAK